MRYAQTRLIYQLVFFALFAFLVHVTASGLVEAYPVNLFLNMSFLAGLGTVLSQGYLAPGLILGAVIAAGTLFVGRFFCGWVCPMGSSQHLASFILGPREGKTRRAQNAPSSSRKVKYIILGAFVLSALFGVSLAGYLDPIALITRFSVTVVVPLADLVSNGGMFQETAFQATAGTAVIFIGAFLAAMVRPRLWCRMICPLGALLGVFSLKPLFRIVRDRESCTGCGLCREQCQGACDPDGDLIPAECVMCMNCVDVCPVGAMEFRCARLAESVADKTMPREALALSRREFLVSSVVGLTSLSVLRNYRNVLGRGYPGRIRPPGALREEDFLARCIRCGECMKVCPTNVLQPAVTETDAEGLWTPVLKMQYGYCEYECTLCSSVCPTRAIKRISLEDKHKGGYGRIGSAAFDRGRCLPWAYGRTCLVCQEVCPVSPKAIYYVEQEFTTVAGRKLRVSMPYMDPERCIGCGVCEFNCVVQDLPAVRTTSVGEIRSPQRRLIL